MEGITFEEGACERKLTLQEAQEKGVGDFSLRLTNIKHWNNLETFPTLFYPMNNKDGDPKHAGLFPPAKPGRSSAPVTEGLAIAVDPRQYISAIRYLVPGVQ